VRFGTVGIDHEGQSCSSPAFKPPPVMAVVWEKRFRWVRSPRAATPPRTIHAPRRHSTTNKTYAANCPFRPPPARQVRARYTPGIGGVCQTPISLGLCPIPAIPSLPVISSPNFNSVVSALARRGWPAGLAGRLHPPHASLRYVGQMMGPRLLVKSGPGAVPCWQRGAKGGRQQAQVVPIVNTKLAQSP
jgi:hypothetical protein